MSGLVSPYPRPAQVLSHAPDQDGFFAMLRTGQMLPFPVRRHYPVADGLRIKKGPLPVRGSWVLISFINGDLRNPVCMGAYHPNRVDPIPNDPDDPFSDYDSHFSGHFSHLHGVSGHLVTQFADGSSLVVNRDLAVPTIHRHTVDKDQKQQRIPFTQQDRNPNPQPTFGFKYTQAGTGTTITTDVSGHVHIDVGSGLNVFVTQGGGSAVDFLPLVTKLVAMFNAHVHPDPQGSNTQQPTRQWTNDDIRSQIFKISN